MMVKFSFLITDSQNCISLYASSADSFSDFDSLVIFFIILTSSHIDFRLKNDTTVLCKIDKTSLFKVLVKVYVVHAEKTYSLLQ